MRTLVALVWAVALVLYPACGRGKNPNQPPAPVPPPMSPGDPEPMPIGDPDGLVGPTSPPDYDAAMPLPADDPSTPQTTP